MAEEMSSLQVKQIVIIVFVEGEPEPQVFIENPLDYLNILENKIQNFKGTFHVEDQLA